MSHPVFVSGDEQTYAIFVLCHIITIWEHDIDLKCVIFKLFINILL
jgi:hypothetical protein